MKLLFIVTFYLLLKQAHFFRAGHDILRYNKLPFMSTTSTQSSQAARESFRSGTILVPVRRLEAHSVANQFLLEYSNFRVNFWFQYAVIASAAGLSIKWENSTVCRTLSPPVFSMLCSVLLTNIGQWQRCSVNRK